MKFENRGRQLFQLLQEYCPAATLVPYLLIQFDFIDDLLKSTYYKHDSHFKPQSISQTAIEDQLPWNYLSTEYSGHIWEVTLSGKLLNLIRENFSTTINKKQSWTLVQLSGGGFSKSFLLLETNKNNSLDGFCIAAKATFLAYVIRNLQLRFTTEVLQQISTEYQLTYQFFENLCQIVCPALYKSPNQLFWVPFGQVMYQGNHETIYKFLLKESECELKAGEASPWEVIHFQTEINNLFEEVAEKWSLCHQQNVLIAHRIKQLAVEAEVSRSQLKEWIDHQQRQLIEINDLKRLAEQMVTPGGATSFEFYRGTENWTIRFEGTPIRMNKKYTLGLIYIHQLLLNPNKDIPCGQLYLPSKNDLQRSSPIWGEILMTYGEKAIPNDERSWLNAIDLIKKSLSTSSANIKTQLLDYLIFLSEQLYRTNPSRHNLSRLIEYKNSLKETKLELEPGMSDQRFYRQEVTLRGVLRKHSEYDTQQRKVYQNVTKAVSRTIHTMNHRGIKNYFKKTLKIGKYCSYIPEKAPPENPAWKLWMD